MIQFIAEGENYLYSNSITMLQRAINIVKFFILLKTFLLNI